MLWISSATKPVASRAKKKKERSRVDIMKANKLAETAFLSQKAEKREEQGDMRAQVGLTAPDSQPRPILPQKPASDYQIHYIIPVLFPQKPPPSIL